MGRKPRGSYKEDQRGTRGVQEGTDAMRMLRGSGLNVLARIFIALVCTFACIALSAAEEKMKYTGTYSSLEYHRTTGDLVGVEIRIVLTRAGYQGSVQFSDGEPGPLMLVRVTFEKNAVRFEIPTSQPDAGVFEGKVSARGIRGRFTYKNGGTQDVDLRRGRSYWD
jgi:hypothetical protein